MPGPLSRTVTRKRVALGGAGGAFVGAGGGEAVAFARAGASAGVASTSLGSSGLSGLALEPPLRASILIQSSGRIWASSQASRELSTASLTVVSRAFRGLSKPRRWRFLAKNSLTAISFCLPAMDSAVSRWGLAMVLGTEGVLRDVRLSSRRYFSGMRKEEEEEVTAKARRTRRKAKRYGHR